MGPVHLRRRASGPLVDPMYLIFPGAALFLLTFGFNLLGDGLSDAIDPRKGVRA